MPGPVPNDTHQRGDDDAGEKAASTGGKPGDKPDKFTTPNGSGGNTPAKDKADKGHRKDKEPPGSQKMPTM